MPSEYDTAELPPNFRERFVAFFARAYPFNSGRGTLANSRVISCLAGRRTGNVYARVFGVRALVPLDDYVGRAMFFFGDLDSKISWVVKKFVRQGDVVLDIGANLGLVSFRLAQIVGPAGVVHSFEPNPKMVDYIQKSLQVNPSLNINIHAIGLGATEGQMTLSVPSGNAGAASLTAKGEAEGTENLQIQVRCLNNVVREEGIGRLDFIKMDVEGFEAEVLTGARDVISKFKPKAILFEEHGFNVSKDRPKSFRLLEELGYEVLAIPKNLFWNRLVSLDHKKSGYAHDFVALAKELR